MHLLSVSGRTTECKKLKVGQHCYSKKILQPFCIIQHGRYRYSFVTNFSVNDVGKYDRLCDAENYLLPVSWRPGGGVATVTSEARCTVKMKGNLNTDVAAAAREYH